MLVITSRQRRVALGLALGLGLALAGCKFDDGGVFVETKTQDGPTTGDTLAWPDLDLGPPPDAGPDVAIVLPDGTPDTLAPDVSPGCVQPRKCEQDIYFECVQGVLKQQAMCALGCDTNGVRCATFAPSNVDPKFLGLGAGDWTISGEIVLDTTTGIVSVGGQPVSYPSGVNFFGTQQYAIVTVRNMQLQPGARLWVRGKRPLIITAERVRIEGNLDAAARGSSPGPGGGNGGGDDDDGEGCGGGYGGRGLDFWDTIHSGGSGASFGGRGGRGGGKSGTPGPSSRAPCGTSDLVPLTGGSGGGGGNGTFETGGHGGGGGGALQITASISIEVMSSGIITAGGGHGSKGSGWPGAGGGGGSGGAILLEAPLVTVEGKVVAEGGGGGGGGVTGQSGSDGSDATGDGARASGGPGADLFGATAGDGGAGSGSQQLDAGGGEDDSPGGGGGGGGSGRVVVRSADGTMAGSGVVSPSKDPAHKLLKIVPL